MSRVTEGRMEQGREGHSGARSDEPEARSEVRWSARRKEGVVMRLLRGESLDLLARETGQPAGRISAWRKSSAVIAFAVPTHQGSGACRGSR